MTRDDFDMTVAAARDAFDDVKQARASLQPHPVVSAMFAAMAAE